MKIGFIGLGIMGKPMAKNLLKAGYTLLVNTHKQATMDEMAAVGAVLATQQEIGEKCDIVMTMPVSYTHLDVYKRQALISPLS